MKVRYLHSDVDTVERVEIIRDLRLGEFDVLVGINLLREGLDLPEVSLVAILDADKEGFLRSERSLIQTIGRAARHLNGTAILYADTMTDSMARAIAETDRRRTKQTAFNAAHGIVPRGVVKRVKDLIDGVYDAGQARREVQAARNEALSGPKGEKDLAKEIKRVEKEMLEHARNLEFEQAAAKRDELRRLKKGFSVRKTVPRFRRPNPRLRGGAPPGVDMRLFRPKPRAGVLFVCMGNICRSPTAEGVFRHHARRPGIERYLRIDSAGTHASLPNAPPDPRSVAAAARRQYDIARVRARRIQPKDFEKFDFVLATDAKVLAALEEMRPPAFSGRLALMLDFAPDAKLREVPDPYYGGPEGFELVLDLVEQAVRGLVPAVRRKIGAF